MDRRRSSPRLRAPEAWVAGQLADLAAAGLVMAAGSGEQRYRFDGAGPHARAVEEIAAVYQQRRFAIIDIIYDRGLSDLRSFSDAFRLQGED